MTYASAATVARTCAVTCRHISGFRCRWVHGEARSGISPSRIRAASKAPAHRLLCPRQQTAGSERHLRSPCDPSRGDFFPPFWLSSPKVRRVCHLAIEYSAPSSTAFVNSVPLLLPDLLTSRSAYVTSCLLSLDLVQA